MDNSIKKVAYENNLQIWAERVRQCRSSGMHVRVWCQEHGVKYSTYYTWQKRVFNSLSTELPSSTANSIPVFAEIPQDFAPCTSKEIAATMKFGEVSVDFYANTSAEFLATFLRSLKSC